MRNKPNQKARERGTCFNCGREVSVIGYVDSMGEIYCVRCVKGSPELYPGADPCIVGEVKSKILSVKEVTEERPTLAEARKEELLRKAAPALLEACRGMLECTGSSDNWKGETKKALKVIEEAIARAEGRTI